MTKTSSLSDITPGQETKFRRLVEDAIKHGIDLALSKVKTDQKGWQRVLENGDKLHKAIAKTIVAKARRLSRLDMTELFFTEDEDLDIFEKTGTPRS